MQQTTPTKTISNLPRKRPLDFRQRVSFTRIAHDSGIAETTLRRRLAKANIAIPSTGFSMEMANQISQWIHSSECAAGWQMVEQFSTSELMTDLASKQKEKFQKRSAKLGASLSANL
jgi:hypothetical protein